MEIFWKFFISSKYFLKKIEPRLIKLIFIDRVLFEININCFHACVNYFRSWSEPLNYVFNCLLAINLDQLNQELVQREIKLSFLQKLKHLNVFLRNNSLERVLILSIHHVQLVKNLKDIRLIFNYWLFLHQLFHSADEHIMVNHVSWKSLNQFLHFCEVKLPEQKDEAFRVKSYRKTRLVNRYNVDKSTENFELDQPINPMRPSFFRSVFILFISQKLFHGIL